MKAVIVEDEPHARVELKRLLSKVDAGIVIVAELDSVADAIAYLSNRPDIDLLFVDIHLADGLSFDIFTSVEISQPVIFTTAYNEFAIQAFDLNSIDYLLKPIEESKLSKAIDKLKKVTENKSPFNITAEKLKALLSPKPAYKDRFVIKMGDQFKAIYTRDIALFEANDNAVYAINNETQRMLVDYKMEEIEKMVNPDQFFRINRGAILNIATIQKVHKHFNGRLKIDSGLKLEEPLLVSRLKVDQFLNWMGQ